MRSGQYLNNAFIIGVSRLDTAEKTRLITVLESKLGLKSYLTMGDNRLAITNPELVVRIIRPHFHESQLSRLERASR